MHKQQAHSKKEGLVRVGYSNLTTGVITSVSRDTGTLFTSCGSVIARDILIIRIAGAIIISIAVTCEDTLVTFAVSRQTAHAHAFSSLGESSREQVRS
jgi:hypothetical protein